MVGLYITESVGASAARLVSKAARFGFGSEFAASVSAAANISEPEVESSTEAAGGSSVAGGISFFWSLSRASSPSTRFSSASSISVFGPRFFGTASACEKPWNQLMAGSIRGGPSMEAGARETLPFTHRKCMDTERPGKPRRQDASDCT